MSFCVLWILHAYVFLLKSFKYSEMSAGSFAFMEFNLAHSQLGAVHHNQCLTSQLQERCQGSEPLSCREWGGGGSHFISYLSSNSCGISDGFLSSLPGNT